MTTRASPKMKKDLSFKSAKRGLLWFPSFHVQQKPGSMQIQHNSLQNSTWYHIITFYHTCNANPKTKKKIAMKCARICFLSDLPMHCHMIIREVVEQNGSSWFPWKHLWRGIWGQTCGSLGIRWYWTVPAAILPTHVRAHFCIFYCGRKQALTISLSPLETRDKNFIFLFILSNLLFGAWVLVNAWEKGIFLYPHWHWSKISLGR